MINLFFLSFVNTCRNKSYLLQKNIVLNMHIQKIICLDTLNTHVSTMQQIYKFSI